jgi:formylglycine-generating enzyme required for sulfatase activity
VSSRGARAARAAVTTFALATVLALTVSSRRARADGDDEDHGAPPAPSATPSAAPPRAAAPRVLVASKDGMLRIPGGRFVMGSADRHAPPNERPPRAVTLAPFWIDRTEVTVGMYRACVDRGVCKPVPRTNTLCSYDAGDPLLPVSCVPWALADAYCRASSRRLPTEAEWELAARGPAGARYPWGGGGTGCGLAITLLRRNAQRSCSPKLPARVGSRPSGASAFGVLDMSGNVEEWVSDWYAPSISVPSPRAGSAHVLRGGGWLSPPASARATSRNWGSSLEAGPNVGFRCARDVLPDDPPEPAARLAPSKPRPPGSAVPPGVRPPAAAPPKPAAPEPDGAQPKPDKPAKLPKRKPKPKPPAAAPAAAP